MLLVDSIADIVSMKSCGALVKRLGALRKFLFWCSGTKNIPIPFCEQTMYTSMSSA